MPNEAKICKMPQLTPAERLRVIELFRIHSSYRDAAKALNEGFPHLNVYHSTIQYQVEKLKL